MRYLVLLLLMLLTVLRHTPCFAQDSAEYRACSGNANTQVDMTACAGAEAKRVDAKLNLHVPRAARKSREPTRSRRKN